MLSRVIQDAATAIRVSSTQLAQNTGAALAACEQGSTVAVFDGNSGRVRALLIPPPDGWEERPPDLAWAAPRANGNGAH